jgi:hypothetical protein
MAKLVTGEQIYPNSKDLHENKYWLCTPCNAYVGTHKQTLNPLGRLANAELRKWKIRAHETFDPLWREGGKTRSQAYYWLAIQLSIPPRFCHIAMFDIKTCKKVVEIGRREAKNELLGSKNTSLR